LSVFEKVSLPNSRFNALDTLVVNVHSVRMPVGFGKRAIKSKFRPLSVMAQFKISVVEVKAEDKSLAKALIIAIAKVENDPNYVAYRQCRKLRRVVRSLLDMTGIHLSGGGIPELIKFQDHFWDYKITVYQGMACKDIMFEVVVDFPKRFNLLYDDVEIHYHVIVNITGAMGKRFMCKACNK